MLLGRVAIATSASRRRRSAGETLRRFRCACARLARRPAGNPQQDSTVRFHPLAALGFIFRETLLRYVSGRINVQFDERLSIFQSQLRNKEQEVDSYRNHLLQAISSKSQAVISKRIEAIEGIWKCHCQNKKLQMAASLLKPLKIDAMNQSINKSQESEQSLRIFLVRFHSTYKRRRFQTRTGSCSGHS